MAWIALRPWAGVSRLGRRLAGLLASLVLLELSVYLAIALSGSLVEEKIRRVADIYHEQSLHLARWLSDTLAGRDIVDSLLGWRYRLGYISASDVISTQGLRANRDYDTWPRPGVLRAAAFGDSFVYANEVPNASAWPAVVERHFPELEVLNYGVGGFGTDQAYLRYRAEGRDLHPHVVLIGFVPDDLRRIVSMYPRFLYSHEPPRFKPRFVLDADQGLVLVPNPGPSWAVYRRYLSAPEAVRELGKLDYWYEPLIYENPLHDWSSSVRLASHVWVRLRRRYFDGDRLIKSGRFNERSEAFAIQERLFKQFARAASDAGAVPVVVFFPDRPSLEQLRNGQPTVYGPLIETVKRQEIRHVDLADAFATRAHDGMDSLFAPGGHYSPLGNELVANWLGQLLSEERSALLRGRE
jgi:hypothetical protein